MKKVEHEILSRPDAVNVAHIVGRCGVLGPGIRFVLWTQGCPQRCAGCHNPQFQPFDDRTWMKTEVLADRILAELGIEGVTFVGGEPFAQALALADLSLRLKAVGLSVMAYSGFTIEQLQSNILPHAACLLREIDLLMDGPYRADMTTERLWRGSDNQRLISVSDRYREFVPQWEARFGQQFEVRLSNTGSVEVLGIPPKGLTRARGRDR